jgi:hypothetical protein
VYPARAAPQIEKELRLASLARLTENAYIEAGQKRYGGAMIMAGLNAFCCNAMGPAANLNLYLLIPCRSRRCRRGASLEGRIDSIQLKMV